MKPSVQMTCLVFVATLVAGSHAASPLAKVIDLLSGLETKIKMEGTSADALAEATKDACDVKLKTLNYAIEDSKNEIADLEAIIGEATATISSSQTKVDEVMAKVAEDEEDLKEATKVRDSESAEVSANEKELMETLQVLGKAIGVLKRELKGGAALTQIQKVGNNVARVLSTLVDAAMLNSRDAAKLTAFAQQQQHASEDDDDEELGAPTAAAYETKSGGILDTLEDLYEKAKTSLAELRKKEVNTQHSYEMLKLSLENSIKYAKQGIKSTEQELAAAKQKKVVAVADLEQEKKTLKSNEEAKAATIADCDMKATEYMTETKSRTEELEVLAKAKAVLMEMTGDAGNRTYSFIQIVSNNTGRLMIENHADLVNYEAVRFVRDLANKFSNDKSLAQLSMRMASAMRMDRNSADPFSKVTKMIKDMIEKLQKDSAEDAEQKAFCDKAMGDSLEKKAALSDAADALTAEIDQKTARVEELKVEVAALQKDLSAFASQAAEANKLRAEEKAEFKKAETDMTTGIAGVKIALKILRQYYEKGAGSADAGNSIITVLTQVLSDFSKGLSERRVGEQMAATEFEKMSNQNAITVTKMESDVKYKSEEIHDLSQQLKSLKSDLSGTQSELTAVLDYLESLNGQCVVKPMTYEERTEQRKAEIAGLKEALEILNGAHFGVASLIQKKPLLRGAHLHRK